MHICFSVGTDSPTVTDRAVSSRETCLYLEAHVNGSFTCCVQHHAAPVSLPVKWVKIPVCPWRLL